MRQASPALIALLNSSAQFATADLYTFTLLGGGVYRFSGAQTALTDENGNTFALGPKFERSRTKLVIGVQVDELDVEIYPEPTDLLGSVPWLQATWTGQLDGALLQVDRLFMQPYATAVGSVVLFAGRVSDIDAARTGIRMKCRSHLELLNIQMPHRLWQQSCTHVFGDNMCLFNRASLALTFAAAAGSTSTLIQGPPVTSTPFAQGTIIGVSGANAGQTRTISAFVSGQSVTVKLAFLSPPQFGDEFEILPGCDHSLATCTNVFSNAIHFGGFPYIPAPENAV
ncbi:MAG: DUF2163 domain-containing protein [Alphaproteobacteria bacterium]|nr:DUF2163 domain-containing protein [Alphaproteobacteria bacterium]